MWQSNYSQEYLKTSSEFRKKEDTVQAAMSLRKTILSNWASETDSMGIFLDLRKVFDTVDQEILLQKLKSLGVRGNVYGLIASCLADEIQFVIVNSENSNL